MAQLEGGDMTPMFFCLYLSKRKGKKKKKRKKNKKENKEEREKRGTKEGSSDSTTTPCRVMTVCTGNHKVCVRVCVCVSAVQ